MRSVYDLESVSPKSLDIKPANALGESVMCDISSMTPNVFESLICSTTTTSKGFNFKSFLVQNVKFSIVEGCFSVAITFPIVSIIY